MLFALKLKPEIYFLGNIWLMEHQQLNENNILLATFGQWSTIRNEFLFESWRISIEDINNLQHINSNHTLGKEIILVD